MRMAILSRIGVFCLLMLTAIPAGHGRTWQDNSGKYSVEAEFVRIECDSVYLRRDDGTEITVPFSRLSIPDQDYVASVKALAGEPLLPSTANDLASLLNELRSADDAVAIIRRFLDEKCISAEEKAAAKELLPEWEGRVNDGLVRIGADWRPKAEVEQLWESTDQAVRRATELFGNGNHEVALDLLKTAERENPEAIRPAFIQGLIASLILHDVDAAVKQFSNCVRRLEQVSGTGILTAADQRNLGVCLNNLAVAQMRQGKFRSAINHWQRSIEHLGPHPAVAANLGRFSRLGAIADLRIPDRDVREAALLYADLVSGTEIEPREAWLYLRLFERSSDDDDLGGQGTHQPLDLESAQLQSSGTGFCVAPTLICTNKHVVEGGSFFRLGTHDGVSADSGVGQIVAVSDESDLAIIRFDKLDAVPLHVSRQELKLGKPVAALGFPAMDVIGTTMTVTTGIVSKLPDARIGNLFLADLTLNSGNSGGPILDGRGEVVGVATAVLNPGSLYSSEKQRFASNYGAGVSADEVQRFLKEHVSDETLEVSPNHEDQSWDEVVGKASPSVFSVLVYANFDRDSLAELWKNAAAKSVSDVLLANAIEDKSCIACNGRGINPCPGRCVRGIVDKGLRYDTWVTRGGTRRIPVGRVKERCGTCSGKGAVQCQYCGGRGVR